MEDAPKDLWGDEIRWAVLRKEAVRCEVTGEGGRGFCVMGGDDGRGSDGGDYEC